MAEDANDGKKVRILNNRPLLFFAVSLFIGIYIAALIMQYAVIFVTVLVCLATAVIILFCIRKRKIAVLLMAVIVGMSAFFISDCVINVDSASYDMAVVRAQISEIIVDKETGKYGYLIKNITINGEKAQGKGAIYSAKLMSVGDEIVATGALVSEPFAPLDARAMQRFRNRILHTIKSDNVSVVGKKKLTINEKIRVSLRDLYIDTMGKTAGGFALALVLGDTSALSNEISNDFKASGVSHIVALSGLNVAFMVAVLLFFMNKLHIRKWITYLFAAVVVVGYGIIAGCPPSMVRAVIMLLIMLVAEVGYLRYDPLSALSLTAALICVVSPLSLFELGFQMSFTAVLGIILFYKPLSSALYKPKNTNTKKVTDKIHKFLSSSIALTLSANSLLIAILFNTFSTFGIYFCLANIIIVPLVSFTYSCLVTLTAVCLIIPHLGILMLGIKYLLFACSGVSAVIASLPYATVSVPSFGILAFCYVLVLVFLSGLFVLNKKYKFRVLAIVSSIAIVLQCVVTFI